jgi:enterochelin esterase family protein
MRNRSGIADKQQKQKIKNKDETEMKTQTLIITLVAILAIPACVMAQSTQTIQSGGLTIPSMPQGTNWDTGGLNPAGSVNWISFYSSVAGSNVNAVVYTPPGYNTSQKYGVVYAYQGISTDPGTIFAGWCVDAGDIADNLIGQGIIKPVIIVALDDQFGGDVRSMTINDAIPYVDSHYSTYADADHRGVYGYSWGGGYAFDIGCENLDTFHYVSPTSAATYDTDGTSTLFPNGYDSRLKCLFISCGDADWDGFYAGNLSIAQYVANYPCSYWLDVPGGGHDGGVWRPAMWNFLQLADNLGISKAPPTTGGTFKLLSRYSGLALEAAGYGTANGTQIQQWSYYGGSSQQWTISSVGNNLYSIIGVASGKCVDISGWGTANDTKVQLWDYAGGSNQKFYFNPTTNGYYEISPSHATGSCLDVAGPSTANGAVVHLWQWVNANNQQWLLQPVDGTVKLISQNSGKSLCPYGGGTANGTQIHQWDYINSSYTDQQWTLTDTGSGNYKFINVKSGRALDVSGGGTANGTKVQLWDYYANTAQLYKLTSTEVGQFRISPNCAPGSCLDVSGVSTANGAVVQLWQWLNQANQKWSVQKP